MVDSRRPAVVDFVDLASSWGNLELMMKPITIASESALVDRSILAANQRQLFGVIVNGFQREHRTEFSPEPTALIHRDDKLVVFGPPESLRRLEGEDGV